MAAPQGTLIGKTVLIAGATSGMGRATALKCAAAGADLILLGRDTMRLEDISRACREANASAVTAVRADAADFAGLKSAFEKSHGILAAVDILVNSVGMNIVERAFPELTDESWAAMLDVNLNAAFNLTRAVLPHMRERRAGLVVHIASTAARKADMSGAAYQASKAGVAAMSHAVMEEEWQNGIRLTVIMPGMTDTPLLDRRPSPVPPEARANALQPEDIADACMFVMGLPARAHVSEIILQPAQR